MKKADVQFHSEGGWNTLRPAINVKYYGRLPHEKVQEYFKCSAEVAEQALEYVWDSGVRRFWEQAQEVATSIFGKGVSVYSEGRSGGWLVVDGLPDIETWDAIMLGKWAGLVNWCKNEIAYLASWESIKEEIEANEWARKGAEEYNLLTLDDGRIVTVAELKNAHQPPEGA